jgi:ABC-type phosphate transport system substrate-binding protein
MRSVTRTFATASAVAVAGLAAAVVSLGPAAADPAATPAAGSIVSVGSDTIQSLDNGLSTAYNGTGPASNFYSWDATGTSPITPKTGCDTTANPPGAGEINRPNGSSAGINALNNTDYTCIDIARSSRGPNTGSTDYFIPFATDAVGWSANSSSTHAPANLTSAELKGIYNCTYTTWNSLPTDHTSSTATIKVFLPQSGSGTRSFFLSALGITATSEPCWQSYTPEENEGTDSVFNDPDVIFPYSLSHYVGQVYDGRGSGNDEPGYLDAGATAGSTRSIDGALQIEQASKVWNSSLSLTYTRNVYHVVREADWNGTGPGGATEASHLKALLNRAAAGGWLCKSGAGLITSYGFQTLASGCGTLQPGV